MEKQDTTRGGFALPTVLIASVVMLTILAVSVTSVVAVRTSLKTQYYQQLAKAAGEAGVAYAKACLAKNNNIPQWSDAKPLTPSSDCAGNQLLDPQLEVLVVGGGGGGGGGMGGGGGGGGVAQVTVPVSAGSSFAITLGAGGAAGSTTAAGGNGGATSFGGYVTVAGGGGGGSRTSASVIIAPRTGGASGGGGVGGCSAATGTGDAGAAGIAGQGYDGGMGSANCNSAIDSALAGNGGGGGGAGGVGGDASGISDGAGVSGVGGIGRLSDISGQQVYYGAGGSGGRYGAGSVGAPGMTGGGIGGAAVGTTGTAGVAGKSGTGAGGGGGSNYGAAGGAGGAGTVFVRFLDNPSVISVSTNNANYTPLYSGSYKIYKITGSLTLTVDSVGTSTCPSDPRCSVVANDTLRSSFSVGSPTLDSEGRALTIPNNGYVQLLRESSGAVWRTYRQPSVQAAVVPDLCSGAATSSLGWTDAAVSSKTQTLTNSSSAQAISLADGNVYGGSMYFRKDFSVPSTGAYKVSIQSLSSTDTAAIYVDGTLATTSTGNVAEATLSTLAAGCHVAYVKLTNAAAYAGRSQFIASIKSSTNASSQPVVVTDSSWRVSAGAAVGYSEKEYYADTSTWVAATQVQLATTTSSSWSAATLDTSAYTISPSCNATCPADSSTYLRGPDFTVTETAGVEVTLSAICDNDCDVMIDGVEVMGNANASDISQQTFTLGYGTHSWGARLYNGVVAAGDYTANPGRITLSLRKRADGTVLGRTTSSWKTVSNRWVSGVSADNDPRSYEKSFVSSPSDMP